MNRKFIIFFVCISTAVLFSVSCKQKEGPGPAYTLKMRLNKGDKFAHDLDMSIKMNSTKRGQQLDMNMRVRGASAFEVVNSSPDSKELAMTYTKMNITFEMKGPEGAVLPRVSTDADRMVVGKTTILKLNKANEIVETTGIENIMWGDSTDAATREELKKMFSKEQMNALFGIMFQFYPDAPVRVGDSWKKETKVNIAGIDLIMMAEYKLTTVKDGIAYVDMEGKYTGKGTMKQGETELEMDMGGGQKGKMNFGLEDGYLKDSQITIDMKTDMTTMDQKIPMTIKGYYTIKGN